MAKRKPATGADDGELVQEIYREILTRSPEHDFEPTTARMERFCELLGDPQRAYRVIHVAGTNGKTSVARMAESLVREHGLRTGLFTSPHLSSVRERIQIDGDPISPADFVATWQEVAPIIEMVDAESAADGGPRMSFFEVFAAMAFVAFANAPVEVAVIEVGMGGRWDATNVVASDVQVIAPISLDHQAYLGDTIGKIASEKAGILRSRAVIGEQVPAAAEVLLAEAQAKDVTLRWSGVHFAVEAHQVAVGGQVLALRGLGAVYAEVFVPLLGDHQGDNAVLALAAVELLLADGGALDPETVRAGFAAVTSPGRLELVRSSPAVLVDAAHNPAGAASLVAALETYFSASRIVGLVGIMADKDLEGVLGTLEPVLDEVVITAATTDRAAPAHGLAELAREVFGADRVFEAERAPEALITAIDRAEIGDELAPLVVATGSILLVAEVRTLLGASYPSAADGGAAGGAVRTVGFEGDEP